MNDVTLYCGDCLDVLPTLPAQSVDCVITDPPYPEIDRAYGRMTEADWWDMMMGVCAETRRILKPTGSAVFILQPNSRKVGSMRGWLWEFMAWVCRDWNMVQDVWWWNHTTYPMLGCDREIGLMRPSVKGCIWAGSPECYKNQDGVLWTQAQQSNSDIWSDRAIRNAPSGSHNRRGRMAEAAQDRGGVTPFNLIPMHNAQTRAGHGASTPLELSKWWTRYICPPGGTLLDPFVGSGTMMLAALAYGCKGIGIDKMPEYVEIAQRRIAEAQLQPALFAHDAHQAPTQGDLFAE
jgi:DNA modification methylase